MANFPSYPAANDKTNALEQSDDHPDHHNILATAANALQGQINDVAADLADAVSDSGTALGAVTAHIADTTDAHDASAVSLVPTGTVGASNVQDAVVEVAGDAATALSGHAADTTSVHGIPDSAALLSGDGTFHFIFFVTEAEYAALTEPRDDDIMYITYIP